MKIFVLSVLKYLGIFKISNFFFRNKLLILAYHGFELHNECEFSYSPLFTKKKTLDRRMAYLKKHNFSVLTLDQAISLQKDGQSFPQNSIVITIDDGWYSTLAIADEIFSKYAFPYTIYVSSYYSGKEIPVLNMVLRYMLWACKKDNIDIGLLNIPSLKGTYAFNTQADKKKMSDIVIKYFNCLHHTEQKHNFIEKVSEIFEIDYQMIKSLRFLDLLTLNEIEYLSDKGVDIQLHTHRHKMPFELIDGIENEIKDNQNCLSPYVKNSLNHFCYPSGVYNKNCGTILRKIGIDSATTCDNGFVSARTDPYYLPRFLDGESIPQIVFEAELYGVLEIFRQIRDFFGTKR